MYKGPLSGLTFIFPGSLRKEITVLTFVMRKYECGIPPRLAVQEHFAFITSSAYTAGGDQFCFCSFFFFLVKEAYLLYTNYLAKKVKLFVLCLILLFLT